jgi:hypothetical protein
MATKKIKDLAGGGHRRYGVYNRYTEYFNLLMNALEIDSESTGERINYAVETFIKKSLLEQSSVGYDKMTDKWFYVYGQGVNELGNPTTLVFVTADGLAFERKACYDDSEDGAYKIDALPVSMSMSALIKEATDFMSNCDLAMRQNLEACKTPYVVVCKDPNIRLSLEQALQEKKLGQACLVVSEQLGDGLKAVNITAEYLVDKFAQARDTENQILLTKLGMLTANTDKKERVQSAEVNASLGQASDYIYMIIDTFNKQMDTYKIPYVMKFNGSMEEIYMDDNEKKDVIDVDVNDANKEGEDND